MQDSLFSVAFICPEKHSGKTYPRDCDSNLYRGQELGICPLRVILEQVVAVPVATRGLK